MEYKTNTFDGGSKINFEEKGTGLLIFCLRQNWWVRAFHLVAVSFYTHDISR